MDQIHITGDKSGTFLISPSQNILITYLKLKSPRFLLFGINLLQHDIPTAHPALSNEKKLTHLRVQYQARKNKY